MAVRSAYCTRVLAVAITTLLTVQFAAAQQVQWTRRVGDPASVSWSRAIASDASGPYLLGWANAPLPGLPAGGTFVRKYDFAGRVVWTWHSGIDPVAARPAAIAVDATGVYVGGSVATPSGSVGFAARLTLDGRLTWLQQLPDLFSLRALAVHASGVYVGGLALLDSGWSPVLGKLDRNGNRRWTITPRETGYFGSIAVDDTGIYAPGDVAEVTQFDLDGRFVRHFGSGGGFLGQLAVDRSGVYVPFFVGHSSTSMRHYARDGRLLWSRRSRLDVGNILRPQGTAVDATGVYLSHTLLNAFNASKLLVSKLSPNGQELWALALGNNAEVTGLTLENGTVYVSGTSFNESVGPFEGLVAKISLDLPASLQALGDINGNGSAELAVLQRDAQADRLTASIKDTATGALLRRIEFDPAYWPQQMVRVDNADGAGADALAVLGVHRTTGIVAAELRNVRTGTRISRVTFSGGFSPHKLVAVRAVRGSGAPALALLQTPGEERPPDDPYYAPRAEVRDARTGAVVRRADFPTFLVNEFIFDNEILDFVAVPDANGNGSSELAAVGRGDFLGPHSIGHFEVRDSATAAQVSDVPAILPDDYAFAIGQAIGLRASDGSARALLVVLQNLSAGVSYRAVAYAAANASFVRSVYFSKVGEARKLLTVPDLDGNGQPELGLLSETARPGLLLLQIKDSVSGASTANLSFDLGGFVYRDVAVIPDVNGNGSADIVVLQERRSDNVVRAQVKDGRTGALIRWIGL